MKYQRIVVVSLMAVVLLFNSACGAGLIPEDPSLPWEVTQDPNIDPPPENTETTEPTPTQEAPTETATATLLVNDPPTETATATQPPNEAPTATASPTQPQVTFTDTPSPTPTQTQAGQVAPPDANFNSPLNIPLDSTTSVLDFVSFPGGDTTDRVRFDVTGMNPNASLSGGRARLIISASCFGTGTQNVTFFTGGQTFSCGQTLIDQEITFDSRTGTITIEAIAGENTYVQWVITGTATRTN